MVIEVDQYFVNPAHISCIEVTPIESDDKVSIAIMLISRDTAYANVAREKLDELISAMRESV